MRRAAFLIPLLAASACASLAVGAARDEGHVDLAVDDDERAFLERRPAGGTSVDVVLLLAGDDELDAVCGPLVDSPIPLWILAPELRDDDDAASLARFLDGLGVRTPVELVAAGRRAALAASFARAAPERVASIALFAPIPPADAARAPTLVVSPANPAQWDALGDVVVAGETAPSTAGEKAALLELWWHSAVPVRRVVVVPRPPLAVDAGALTFGFDEVPWLIFVQQAATLPITDPPNIRPPTSSVAE